MKLTKEPRELGESWQRDYEPLGWFEWTLITLATIGTIILIAEYTGLSDRFINSFN